MPYVEARVAGILADKEARNSHPILATETEIVSEIRKDVFQCMIALHKSGKYRGTDTINEPALMKK